MTTLTIELPDQLQEFVEAQVAAGQYVDGADFVRDILRERQRMADELHELLMEGEASGISDRNVDEIIADARNRWIAHRPNSGG